MKNNLKKEKEKKMEKQENKDEIVLDLWYCHTCNTEVLTLPGWPPEWCPVCLEVFYLRKLGSGVKVTRHKDESGIRYICDSL